MHPFDKAIFSARRSTANQTSPILLSRSFADESDWADSMREPRSTQWLRWMTKTLSPGMSRGIYRD
ncbi:hypothetical protein BTK96_000664 [Burkholderia pyrrocinia]|uniref:hypothetical protein n=1 Tax=Burkholderia sp. IT-111MI5 TaxID=3026439 RepID=UPI00195A8E87|nr:hypothetical protein [Burkholderia pyrrocinia]EKS9893435.1 hypothetical protein [Burkholderia pyrrocinia]EKS9905609.1 hypothetical protein [Burkholderia pyrrocinia]